MQFQKSSQQAFLNFLKSKYERFTTSIQVNSYPYLMLLDPTSICQLQCPACPTGLQNAKRHSAQPVHFREQTMMEAPLFESMLEEMGEYLFFIRFYNWGEPLLNPKLPDYIKLTQKYGIYTDINTNLSLKLTDERITALLNSGIDEIAVSIDGFDQVTYEQYRIKGNFTLAKQNLERLVYWRDKLGLSIRIVWNFLIFNFNAHQIKSIKAYCKELNIDFEARIATLPPEHPEWRITPELLASIQAEIHKPTISFLKAEQKNSCAWHYAYSLVNANGTVSPCCALWEEKEDFGTVTTHFHEIWNNRLFQKARCSLSATPPIGLEDVTTVCDTCSILDSVGDIYTDFDFLIYERFIATHAHQYPVLERAFHLLSDKDKFIDFYEENLLDKENSVYEIPKQEALEYTLQARTIEYFPTATDTINFNIDVLDQHAYLIKVMGWAYIEAEHNAGCRIHVLLSAKENQQVYSFVTNTVKRTDVAAYFQDEGISDSGFEVLIPSYQLPSGVYQLGLYIELASITALKQTEIEILIDNHTITEKKEESPISMS